MKTLKLLEYEKRFVRLVMGRYDFDDQINNAHLIHLSDLHIGKKHQLTKENRLVQLLRNHLVNNRPDLDVYTFISGDLIDNPTEQNAAKYIDFKDKLEMIGLKEPVSVLGNHDIHFSGLLRTGKQLKNAITSLAVEEDISIFNELGLIVVKFNSNIDGKFAQGKVGVEQLARIGNLLDRVPNLNSYCLIAMLHHHPFELDEPNWMRRSWYEQLIGKFWMNESLKLVDSDIFIQWIQNRGIRYIIHGHKHIPTLFERKNINIISAGSSTGNVLHEHNSKTFLTYNYINYNIDLKTPLSTTIVFEDLMGAGTRHYQIQKY